MSAEAAPTPRKGTGPGSGRGPDRGAGGDARGKGGKGGKEPGSGKGGGRRGKGAAGRAGGAPSVLSAAKQRTTLREDVAVVAEGLRVEFRPFIERRPTFKKILKPGRRRTAEPVVALDGVSLSIRKGEAFGVIGSNGAGKSTLLQVLAGTLPPDAGSVTVYGTAPVLLALGVGFNRALSGRRNVYLGGLAAGLRKAEIDRRFDSIVDFADIGKAIERPVGTYSSGMYARLAFSVAMQTEPDLLLVDELFAVGDEAFKVKSAKTMEGILERAGTIVMVSHGLGRLQRFCDRLAWLDQGKVMAVGEPAEVIAQYRAFTGVDESQVKALDFDDEDGDA